MAKTSKSGSTTPQAHFHHFDISPSTLILLLVGAAGLWLLDKLLPVLCVLSFALFLVCALNSTVKFMEDRGLNRTTSIALVFFLMLLAATLIAMMAIRPLADDLSTLSDQLPLLRAQLAERLADIPFGSSLADWVRHGKYKYDGGAVAMNYSVRMIELVIYAVSGIFLAFYIMLERDILRGGLFSLVPRAHHVRLSRILLNLEKIVGAYIRGQMLLSSMIMLFTFILLTLVGVSNPMVFAFFAGVADVLPYIGVFLSVGPAVLATLSQGQTPALIVLFSMLIYEEVESRLLIPKIFGKQFRLPASVILFSLLTGSVLVGPFAALLSLPVAATIMMLIEELRFQLPGETKTAEKKIIRRKNDRAEKEYERKTEGVPTEESAAIAVQIAEERLKEEKETKDENTAKS